jgi:hypothetical protein
MITPNIDWQVLVFILGVLVAMSTAAIQIGVLKNQILINTGRLTELEIHMAAIREHAAQTNARWPDIERRINRLESIVNHITIEMPKNTLH